MMSISNFNILGQMSVRNMDIRLYTDVVEMAKIKDGARVTMGADDGIITDWMSGKLRVILLAFDAAQFDEVKAKLISRD